MLLVLAGLSKQLSQPAVRGGSSKTFAVQSSGSREASCDEEKGERGPVPFRK